LGTMMLVPVVLCPFATVTTCGVVRLPPLLEVPPDEGAVGVVGLLLVLEDPPPQAIKPAASSKTGSIGTRISLPRSLASLSSRRCC
jgi:hypothetical protein